MLRILFVADPFVVVEDDNSEIRIGSVGTGFKSVYVKRQHGVFSPLGADISDMSLDSTDNPRSVTSPSEQFEEGVDAVLDELEPFAYSDAKDDVVDFLKEKYRSRLNEADNSAKELGRALDYMGILVWFKRISENESVKKPTMAEAIDYCVENSDFLTRAEIMDRINTDFPDFFELNSDKATVTE